MDIIIYNELVRIEFSATNKKSFPKNSYNVELYNNEIRVSEIGTDITEYKIVGIESVSSISNWTTGVEVVVAVPATISLLFDLIEPYFYASLSATIGAINLNTDTLEASNDAIQISVASIDTKTTAKSELHRLENEANDLVITISYLDAGLADEREDTIVYSSVALSLTVTKTLGYNGASPYRVLTITLS